MYLLNSNILKKTLFSLRQIVSLEYRRKILSNIIFYEIEKLEKIRKKKIIRILDFGSGYNPDLIKLITKKLSNKYKNTNFIVYCYDFYNDRELKLLNNNSSIKFFNSRKLTNINKTKFNFCLIIDVLHHIGIEKEKKVYTIIKKLKQKSKYLIIKDHFQYGFFSNFTLKIMDIFGNLGDRTRIPTKYFSIKLFENLIAKLNLVEIKRIDNKKYYKWYWFYINSKKLQFISILM